MQSVYAAHPATFQAISDKGLLPSQSFYAELDFQAGWLMAVDAGIAAILEPEARTGARFETIMSLNFANPFPSLMERTGVRHVPIGADPSRAVPPPNEAARAAIAETDLILYPLCPLTVANQTLRGIYAEATAGRREIALGACWKGYVRGVRAGRLPSRQAAARDHKPSPWPQARVARRRAASPGSSRSPPPRRYRPRHKDRPAASR